MGLAAAAASLTGCGFTPSPAAAPPLSPAVSSPTVTGPELAITAVRACPATGGGEVVSAAPDSGRVLASPQPAAGLLCRYSGVRADGPERLLASARLTTAQAQDIASLLSKLPTLYGTVACPDDTGARDIVLLTYAHQASVTVDVGLSGCGLVTNGWFSRVATPALDSALSARVGAPSS
jgi:hypothetical protein